jgi:hypothetical protein
MCFVQGSLAVSKALRAHKRLQVPQLTTLPFDVCGGRQQVKGPKSLLRRMHAGEYDEVELGHVGACD